MAKYIGVDWASKGWFGVILGEEGTYETDFFPSIWSLWKNHSDADRVFIDIPIGLPTDGKRACDVEAREKLGRQGSRVFYTPIRDAVYEHNLEDAKETNEAVGFSIQNQAWGIVPRIREVDEFLDMNPTARDRLIETHPELCFYALNDQQPVVASKTTEAGIQRRAELLAAEHPDARSIYEASIERYMTPKYASFLRAEDDILDALVAAVTAKRADDRLTSLPERGSPPRDERGLPMQIVYPSDLNQTRLTTLTESGE